MSWKNTHPWIDFSFSPPSSDEYIQRINRIIALHNEADEDPYYHTDEVTGGLYSDCVRATTGIEGNKLGYDVVAELAKLKKWQPVNKSQQEIKNALAAYRTQWDYSYLYCMSPEAVMGIQKKLLEKIKLPNRAGGFYPKGVVRKHGVIVGAYRGAPAKHCSELLMKMCDWLETGYFGKNEPVSNLHRAIMAHLYIAWIHPFADGNGRTARFCEYIILRRSFRRHVSLLTAKGCFERHMAYYKALNETREKMSPMPFLEFMTKNLLEDLQALIAGRNNG